MRQKRSNPLVVLLSLLLLLGCSFGEAAEAPSTKIILQLQNGDKITGDLLSENNERIVLRTAWKEKITIPKTQVLKRETPAPAVAAAPATPTAPAAAPKTTPAPAAAPAAPTAATPAGTNSVKMIVKAQPRPWAQKAKTFFTNWNGSFEMGANISSGTRDMELYHTVLNASHMSWSNRVKNTIDFRIDKGKTEGVTSVDKVDGALKTDIDISKDKKTYVYNVGGAGYDNVQRIDLSYREGPGIGYKLLNKTNILTKADAFKMNVELGGLYQKFEYATGEKKEILSLRFAEDLAWTFTEPRLTLTQKFQFVPSIEDPSDYTSLFQTDISWPIVKRITLKFTVLDEYTSKPVSNVEKNNLQLRTSLGVTF